MPSSPQTVTTQVAYDYLVDTAGRAVDGVQVHCILNFNQSTLASPAVSVGPIQQTTTTDANGYFQFSLVPNASISPANTTYSIITPFNSYDISVPASAGPWRTTDPAVIVGTPQPLSPATTNLTGPITVTGNETVTGNLTVNGTTTLAGTTTGALSTGAVSAGGDLTILSAFRLLFGAAVSKLVPGATSFSIRNNADNADNLLISNAGAATVRAGLTVTAGGETITAGGLTVTGAPDVTLGTAASRIVPGATSLSFRNNANNADNLILTNGGLATLRNALSIPPVAGGTVASSSYGSVPVKLDVKTGNGTSGTLTFSSIPSGYTNLWISFFGQTSNAAAQALTLQFNGDTGNHYYDNQLDVTSATTVTEHGFGVGGVGSGTCGALPASATANTGGGKIDIHGYSQTNFRIVWRYHSWQADGGAAGNSRSRSGGGIWAPTSLAAITSIALILAAGFWVNNSTATLWGEP